ncbi:MAG: response regulator [Dehalococcoidia bacterium]|nr:response regulator [Dehalococcoidia bacterium]
MDKKKILIADDEGTVRLVVEKMLDKDYIVLEATNGEEAVRIAKAEQPDLILMDLIMPKMDGYTACSEIKADQSTKGIPVVILTAVGHELNKKFATEMGAAGYVTKPFNIQDLINVISPLLVRAF